MNPLSKPVRVGIWLLKGRAKIEKLKALNKSLRVKSWCWQSSDGLS